MTRRLSVRSFLAIALCVIAAASAAADQPALPHGTGKYLLVLRDAAVSRPGEPKPPKNRKEPDIENRRSGAAQGGE